MDADHFLVARGACRCDSYRIAFWSLMLIFMAIAPLCESLIPVEWRILARNSLQVGQGLAIMASGEAHAAVRRRVYNSKRKAAEREALYR